MMPAIVHDTAIIESDVTLGDGTRVWHYTQIRPRARIGTDCNIGGRVFVDFDVVMGDNCKVQNNSCLYHGAIIGNGVFIGPAVLLLNDRRPRAVNPDMTPKSADDWIVAGVTVGDGAAIGGGSTICPGVTIGRWAMVGAGSTVTKDVPDHALVYGNPARVRGFVSPAGHTLPPAAELSDPVRLPAPEGGEVVIPLAAYRLLETAE